MVKKMVKFCLKEDELKNAVLCVFANKQDIEGAMSPSEVANSLGLPSLKNRKYQIFKTSAVKGTGLDEAMEWLVFFIFIFCLRLYFLTFGLL